MRDAEIRGGAGDLRERGVKHQRCGKTHGKPMETHLFLVKPMENSPFFGGDLGKIYGTSYGES